MSTKLAESTGRIVTPTPANSVNTVLADLLEAIETYAETYLKVEIFDVNPPGNVVDANEDVTFKVRVSNSGPLHVNEVTVLLEGLNGTRVRMHEWTGTQISMSTGVFDRIPAHSANDFVASPEDHYHFVVGGAKTAVTDLVRASIKEWNVENFDHLFAAGHSDVPASGVNDVYSSSISPS